MATFSIGGDWDDGGDCVRRRITEEVAEEEAPALAP
jgi:hypothetical protein